MADTRKEKPLAITDLPDGLREIADLPPESAPGAPLLLSPPHAGQKAIEPAKEASPAAIQLPAAAPPARPRTQKEQKLDELIAQRQSIIEQLKAKNPSVAAHRHRIASIIPNIRGKGASHTIKLMGEADRLEFSIATEAYTPAKEKEMIKRMRQIKAELSKHKEVDEARKAIEAERTSLHSSIAEIRALEQKLAEARQACEAAYQEVLAERKAAYENRQHAREQKAHMAQEREHKKFEDLKRRVREEKHREEDNEAQKYYKDYDDTVSMDEICIIEKKEKKKD